MSIDSKIILVVIEQHCEIFFNGLFNVKEMKLTHVEKVMKYTLIYY